LIFILSAQPNLRFVSDAALDFVVRKLGHIGVFGILALLLWRALAETTGWRRPWAWAFALTVLYAASDELHQGFVAGRHPSVADVTIEAMYGRTSKPMVMSGFWAAAGRTSQASIAANTTRTAVTATIATTNTLGRVRFSAQPSSTPSRRRGGRSGRNRRAVAAGAGRRAGP
jgi:VanZ like family